jgi:hypothetical protein
VSQESQWPAYSAPRLVARLFEPRAEPPGAQWPASVMTRSSAPALRSLVSTVSLAQIYSAHCDHGFPEPRIQEWVSLPGAHNSVALKASGIPARVLRPRLRSSGAQCSACRAQHAWPEIFRAQEPQPLPDHRARDQSSGTWLRASVFMPASPGPRSTRLQELRSLRARAPAGIREPARSPRPAPALPGPMYFRSVACESRLQSLYSFRIIQTACPVISWLAYSMSSSGLIQTGECRAQGSAISIQIRAVQDAVIAEPRIRRLFLIISGYSGAWSARSAVLFAHSVFQHYLRTR